MKHATLTASGIFWDQLLTKHGEEPEGIGTPLESLNFTPSNLAAPPPKPVAKPEINPGAKVPAPGMQSLINPDTLAGAVSPLAGGVSQLGTALSSAAKLNPELLAKVQGAFGATKTPGAPAPAVAPNPPGPVDAPAPPEDDVPGPGPRLDPTPMPQQDGAVGSLSRAQGPSRLDPTPDSATGNFLNLSPDTLKWALYGGGGLILLLLLSRLLGGQRQ